MPTTAWSTEQLAEFVAAVATARTPSAVAQMAVERAAEALDAEVAAIVTHWDVVAAVGYPDGAAPVGQLRSIRSDDPRAELDVPGLGRAPATAVPLETPAGATLVVARCGPNRLSPAEASLLRGMAQVTSMAISNTDRRVELAASRARIVAAADDARRRIERDLHDGAQQRLVALALDVQGALASIPAGESDIRSALTRVADGLRATLDELHEIAHGIHPAVLTQGGIPPALRTLARRSPVPVALEVDVTGRFPEQVEVACYYVVSEMLTNAAKHARASAVGVSASTSDGILRLTVSDDGIGGADPARGSGLIGLRDRVEAIGGSIEIASRPGEGTAVHVELPLPDPAAHPDGL